MIRLVLGIFGVAGVLCALILMPPIGNWRIFETDIAAADAANDGVQVTRNVDPTFSETGELIADGYTFKIDDATIEETSAGVLAGLRGTPDLTLTPLQTIVVAALQAGQSDAEIDAALNAAAIAGEISVPATLVTGDGRLDTIALLAGIDTAARAAEVAVPVTHGDDPVLPDAAAIPEVIEITGPRFYVVAPGDSLGSISTVMFGSPQYDDLIFEANRDVLSDPNDLSVGQRLVIPEQ